MTKLPRIRTNVQNILASLTVDGIQTEKQLLDPIRPRGMTNRWMCSLFRIRAIPRGEQNSRASLVLRDLIRVVGFAKNGARLYVITELGRAALLDSVMRAVKTPC